MPLDNQYATEHTYYRPYKLNLHLERKQQTTTKHIFLEHQQLHPEAIGRQELTPQHPTISNNLLRRNLNQLYINTQLEPFASVSQQKQVPFRLDAKQSGTRHSPDTAFIRMILMLKAKRHIWSDAHKANVRSENRQAI